jgi:hypothetical protein
MQARAGFLQAADVNAVVWDEFRCAEGSFAASTAPFPSFTMQGLRAQPTE